MKTMGTDSVRRCDVPSDDLSEKNCSGNGATLKALFYYGSRKIPVKSPCSASKGPFHFRTPCANVLADHETSQPGRRLVCGVYSDSTRRRQRQRLIQQIVTGRTH